MMMTTALCAEAITIADHPAFRLRNRNDNAAPTTLPLWMDLGPIGASQALFFLRTDRGELFAGAAPQLLGALAAGAPLTRYAHDFAYDGKGVIFSVTVVGSEGRLVEFKALEAFELPPAMPLDDESLALARPPHFSIQ